MFWIIGPVNVNIEVRSVPYCNDVARFHGSGSGSALVRRGVGVGPAGGGVAVGNACGSGGGDGTGASGRWSGVLLFWQTAGNARETPGVLRNTFPLCD